MKNILFLPIFFLFASCATQFFVIENIIYGDGDGKRLNQTIVISNLPKDQKKLIEIIEEYNRRTISYREILEYDIRRCFYRETMFLTRNFEEGKPYPTNLGEFIYGPEQLISHYPILLMAFNTTTISGQHYFDMYIGTNRVFRKIIDNPEEYYLKE
jgi:hypothetical protein